MENPNKELILITGGHLTPAVAVINELKKRGYNNLLWVGLKHNQSGNKELSPEFVTIKDLGIPFVNLKTGKLVRHISLGSLWFAIKNIIFLSTGTLKALYIILRYRPAVVLSFGGYIPVPIAFWGRIFGRKIVTHEQTILTGLANKFVGKLANKVLISWESSRKYFDPKKTVLTGNPIRRDIFVIKSNTLTRDFDTNYPTLLIYGGNQGSNFINSRLFEVLPEILRECNVIHQTGNSTVTQDYKKAQEFKESLGLEYKLRYQVRDYILQNEVGEALNKSDLVFGRSGANNVSEFMALGKLCILMPIPWASFDEQTKNAEYVAETGLAYVLKQTDNLSSKTVYQSILLGLNQLKTGKGFNGRSIEECKSEAKSRVILDAPQNVVNEIEKLLKK